MDEVRIGDMVRIDLHGRRVGGWIVAVGVEPSERARLKPLAKVSGRGPSPEVLELAEWAAWRWAGRRAQLLPTASPARGVAPGASAPAAAVRATAGGPADPRIARALAATRGVLRMPPGDD